uniref:Secretory carrier-associated membrane protein n=1 Tax=Cyprinus carpio TaxID=7962 RepID=A0A8C2K5F5_CYPCA
MSGFDSNPFEDPVDVNPFQVRNAREALRAEVWGSSAGFVLMVGCFGSDEFGSDADVSWSPLRLWDMGDCLTSHLFSSGKQNNWPPLPKFFPIKPCFYQDFSEEIPQEHQRLCKMIYYLWMWQCVTLFLNVLACLAEFTTNTDAGVDFGLSILWFILFAPCSFLCWFRPVYKAFRSDSSFNFFFFFFIFLAQIAVSVIQSVGIPRWGNSGWISAIAAIGKNKAVGVIMMVVAAFFTATAALSIVLLKMVHSHYRRTGASFQKAQQEFSQGVLTNRTFQTAAASAATTAAQSSLFHSYII